jgi:putative ABC transport system substrate-binding protein
MDRSRRALAIAVLGAMLPPARAQRSRIARVGVLIYSSPEADPTYPALRRALLDLGYVEGRNLQFESRAAGGDAARLPQLADELVQAKPDLICALGGDVTAIAQKATRTIPVVMWASNDPVQMHFVESLARPGGNITGITLVLDELAGKRVALLKELMPRLATASVLWNPEHADPEFREMQRAARGVGVQLQSLEVHRGEDLAAAFDALQKAQSEALLVVSARLIILHKKRILDFGQAQRLPVIADWGDWESALLSYGPNVGEMVRRMASCVDLVLKGAQPSQLPVQQPTKFDLVVNLKSARRFDISVPPTVLLRADRVIE